MAQTPSREIAVIDDDAAVLESFQFMLELAGFEVETYRSAISFLERGKFTARCIILDQHMPVMTGLELTARLRADGITLPVLLITSTPSPAIVARAAEIGVDQVLQKPATEADLISFVTNHK
jgi:two-component system, LuxR family, response regulator FixJ